VFLIGAYAKYNWPYCWLRSAARTASVDDLDSPLDLPSTQQWMSAGGCRTGSAVLDYCRIAPHDLLLTIAAVMYGTLRSVCISGLSRALRVENARWMRNMRV
jgi:hypothetical protein